MSLAVRSGAHEPGAGRTQLSEGGAGGRAGHVAGQEGGRRPLRPAQGGRGQEGPGEEHNGTGWPNSF